MAPPKRPWFRFYVETFTDVELRVLPPAQRWVWTAILGLARMSPVAGVLLDKAGEPMTDAHIAEFAAVPAKDVKAALKRFTALGMVRRDDVDALVVSKWDARQFESDDVTVRTRKHRARNVPSNDDETPDGTTHGTVPPSVDLSEVQSSTTSTSSPTSSGDELDDDEDLIEEAMRLLALRDLERVTAESGPRGDDERWLATAIKRRMARHHDEAARMCAPGIHPEDIANKIDRPESVVPAKPGPLDEAQQAQYQAAQDGIAKVREATSYEASPEEKQRVLAQLRARKPA